MDNSTAETAYMSKTNVGPLFSQANIVNMDHTLHDALPAAAKAQALTKDDLEHAAKEARAYAEINRRTSVTVSAGSIAKGK